MLVQLPDELRPSMAAIVRAGHYPSVEDAFAAAARLLLRQIGPIEPGPVAVDPDLDP